MDRHLIIKTRDELLRLRINNILYLEADLDQGGGQRFGVGAVNDVNVVGQPAQRNHRHVSFPFH